MLLFQRYDGPALHLKNHVVMAPMTRNRATADNVPTPLMAEYYGQRAGAGLIVTEGTSPSPNGVGYPRIPGLYNDAQVAGWRPVIKVVRAQGAKIFVQLMHTGRVGHRDNLPQGAEVLGPVDGACPGEVYTDKGGLQPYTPARAMTDADIAQVIEEFAHAAKLAVDAGFDGIELHAANGYLLEQFLNGNVNQRSDLWGGSAQNRNRLVLAVARAVVAAIGAQRVGIRVSPYGAFNGTGAYDGMEQQFLDLARELSGLQLAYLHLVDHSSMGAPEVPAEFKQRLRAAFSGAFIASGGLDATSAEQVLKDGRADLVAFGRPFIANPDFVERVKEHVALNAPDGATFYTPGAKGYTDYPRATQLAAQATA